jgi:pyruvate dehydrogenase E2 component (dihydrolipoamide acetyltransferase)
MMGIEQFTAIINAPNSAILAVGSIKEVVVSDKGQFKVTNIMKVTLTCDHRTVDGAVGSAFLVTFKGFLENPVTMLV